MTDLQIEYRAIDALIPYVRNARTHSEAQIAQIAGSIREFGFNNPILVDGQYGVIAGHGRLLAARQLNMTLLPVIELAHLTDAQKRAFILAENKLTERGGWDQELLSLELADLEMAGFDLDLTGFDAGEIANLFERSNETDQESSEEGDAEIPEVPMQPISRLGDLWLLGEHRLVCGDATDPCAVEFLMRGEQAVLCFTSPPYGQQRDYASGGIRDWDRLMQGVFAQLPMAQQGQVLVNLGLIHRDNEVIPYWDDWLSWMRRQGWRRFAWYVWDQGPGMPGDWNGRLAPSFEFIFHFNRESQRPNKIIPCKTAGQHSHQQSEQGMRRKDGRIGYWSHVGKETQEYRIPDAVMRIMRQCGGIGEGIDHPAVFPVALPTHVLEAYSKSGDIVLEPFNGSGTSMLAAQKTGRRCRAIEKAPEYVDVALRRFQQNYPDVSITLAATGQSFDAVAAERQGKLNHPNC